MEAPRNAKLHLSIWVGLGDPPSCIGPAQMKLNIHTHAHTIIDQLLYVLPSLFVSIRVLTGLVCCRLKSIGRSKLSPTIVDPVTFPVRTDGNNSSSFIFPCGFGNPKAV